MRRLTVLLLAVLIAFTAACSNDDDKGATSADGSSSTTTVASDDGGAMDDATTKPTVTVPEGDPPTELVIDDLVVGDGDELTAGRQATVHYVGVSWSTGEEFDSSWDRGQPFTTVIPGQLIEGWNEGMLGMKVGGRRQLIIPPDKGYGAAGAGDAIGPNETLVFVIDLVAVS